MTRGVSGLVDLPLWDEWKVNSRRIPQLLSISATFHRIWPTLTLRHDSYGRFVPRFHLPREAMEQNALYEKNQSAKMRTSTKYREDSVCWMVCTVEGIGWLPKAPFVAPPGNTFNSIVDVSIGIHWIKDNRSSYSALINIMFFLAPYHIWLC